jgi:hypothetical protein
MATKNAPRTVKDVPAQEFVVALAQYFRSTGKVRRMNASRARWTRAAPRSSDDVLSIESDDRG